jgi:hypothetical protein
VHTGKEFVPGAAFFPGALALKAADAPEFVPGASALPLPDWSAPEGDVEDDEPGEKKGKGKAGGKSSSSNKGKKVKR